MRRERFQGGLGKVIRAEVQRPKRRWRMAAQHKANNIQCAHCGRLATLEVDHVVPLHLGGTDAVTNLQSLCKECHARKTAREATARAGK